MSDDAQTTSEPGPVRISLPELETPPEPEQREPRVHEARLRVTHIEPWSATRVAFALSCALAIVWLVAVVVFWIVMKITGVWGLIDDSLTSVLSDGSQEFDVGNYFGLWRLLVFTGILSVINIVLMTALAAVGARIYNTVAELVGGVRVTFADD